MNEWEQVGIWWAVLIALRIGAEAMKQTGKRTEYGVAFAAFLVAWAVALIQAWELGRSW